MLLRVSTSAWVLDQFEEGRDKDSEILVNCACSAVPRCFLKSSLFIQSYQNVVVIPGTCTSHNDTNEN